MQDTEHRLTRQQFRALARIIATGLAAANGDEKTLSVVELIANDLLRVFSEDGRGVRSNQQLDSCGQLS